MTDKEFDSVLNRIASDETMPFDEKNWDMLQNRLDSKPSRRLMVLLPFTLKQYAAAACLAIVASAGYWMLNNDTNNGNDTIATTTATNKAIETASAPNIANDTTTINTTTTLNTTIASNTTPARPRIAAAHITHTPQLTPQQVEGTRPQLQTTGADIHYEPPVATNNTPQQLPAIKKENKPQLHFNELDAPSHNDLSLAVNGGVALYAGNNLTAGVLLKNKISERIALQAGIAYTQGSQDVYTKNERITETPIITKSDAGLPIMSTLREVETTYEQHSRNISYLQLSPAVNVKLHDKLNSSVGVDLQKALIDDTKLNSINDSRPPSAKKIPGMDPGVMLNLNYNVTPRIGGGITYRHSVMDLGTNGDQYAQRSYFMFQLQYTLIK